MTTCLCGCGREGTPGYRGLAQRCYMRLWRRGGVALVDRYAAPSRTPRQAVKRWPARPARPPRQPGVCVGCGGQVPRDMARCRRCIVADSLRGWSYTPDPYAAVEYREDEVMWEAR